jgi:hypothetical protein
VSTEQRENLEAILRQSAFPPDIDIGEQRRQLRELISAQPLPAGVTVTAAALGGVPIAEITIDGTGPRHVVLSASPSRSFFKPGKCTSTMRVRVSTSGKRM